MLKQPFMVVGLPRSRTAWFSRFLSFGEQVCVHEPSLRWTKHEDLKRWLARNEGGSDSMLTWLAHEARKAQPDMPLVVIRRNRGDVLDSLKRLHYAKESYLPYYLMRLDQRLDEIEDELPCYSTNFSALASPAVCGAIFKYCLGQRMPLVWWMRWKDENVQADIPETLKVLRENVEGIKSVYGEKHWKMQG